MDSNKNNKVVINENNLLNEWANILIAEIKELIEKDMTLKVNKPKK